jgi:NAD(P)H-nitrite reductase large subunit
MVFVIFDRRNYMAEDLLEKGAIVQRDKETYAIAPHIPGGIITDFNLLRRVADVAEKYGVKTIKLTSAQRFAMVGLKFEDLDPVWQEVGMVRAARPLYAPSDLPRNHLLPPPQRIK